MRLIVARCEVSYSGRLNAFLPESTRLLMLKDDGSVLVHADAGGYKPLNWMTPPTVIEDSGDAGRGPQACGPERGPARDQARRGALRREHDMGEAAALEKDGVERDLQLLLAADPAHIGEGLRLVKREWPTDVGPVDLMCRDEDDGWVAVEIKRVGTIDAVEQLSRYLDCIRVDRRGPPAAASSSRSRSSRRRSHSPRAAASTASRSTSRCCAASASPSSRCSRLARIPGEQLRSLRVDLAPHRAGSGANGSTLMRSFSTRHAPATKPSTVNVCFVVPFFLLKTTSMYSGERSAPVAVREDDRVERR